MFYCCPSMHKTGSTAADLTCEPSRGAQDAFCASLHQQRLTGLCTLKRAPRERPVDEHWARDWLLEWTGSSQTNGGMKWALCKGDEAPGSYPCQNCFIFEWSGNRKREGKHHIPSSKGDKNTYTHPLTLSNCMPGTSGVPRVSTGTCSLPHDPCHGGGDGNVLSSRLEISPGWEEPGIDWNVGLPQGTGQKHLMGCSKDRFRALIMGKKTRWQQQTEHLLPGDCSTENEQGIRYGVWISSASREKGNSILYSQKTEHLTLETSTCYLLHPQQVSFSYWRCPYIKKKAASWRISVKTHFWMGTNIWSI